MCERVHWKGAIEEWRFELLAQDLEFKPVEQQDLAPCELQAWRKVQCFDRLIEPSAGRFEAAHAKVDQAEGDLVQVVPLIPGKPSG